MNTTEIKGNIEQKGKQVEIQLPVNLRDYFAAHAPEIPEWFKAKTWFQKEAVDNGNTRSETRFSIKDVFHTEDPMDHLTRWRFTYANSMMLAMEKK